MFFVKLEIYPSEILGKVFRDQVKVNKTRMFDRGVMAQIVMAHFLTSNGDIHGNHGVELGSVSIKGTSQFFHGEFMSDKVNTLTQKGKYFVIF